MSRACAAVVRVVVARPCCRCRRHGWYCTLAGLVLVAVVAVVVVMGVRVAVAVAVTMRAAARVLVLRPMAAVVMVVVMIMVIMRVGVRVAVTVATPLLLRCPCRRPSSSPVCALPEGRVAVAAAVAVAVPVVVPVAVPVAALAAQAMVVVVAQHQAHNDIEDNTSRGDNEHDCRGKGAGQAAALTCAEQGWVHGKQHAVHKQLKRQAVRRGWGLWAYCCPAALQQSLTHLLPCTEGAAACATHSCRQPSGD